MYRMRDLRDQTEGRGTRIKSKLDPTSHDRENPRVRNFVPGYEIDPGVCYGTKGHNVSIWSGKWWVQLYIGYWLK